MSRFVFDDPRVEERHLQFDFEDELRRLDERTQYLNHSDNDGMLFTTVFMDLFLY